MTIGRCFSLAGTVLLRTTRTTFRKSTKQQSLYLFQQQIFRYIYTRKKHKSVTPVFVQALKLENKDKLAIVDQNGKFSYNDILHHSKILSDELKRLNNEEHFKWKCVAFLCDNDVSYVVTKWAIWLAKGVAVPLCKSHPASEWEYVISDSQCSMIVATTEYSSQIKPISDKLNLPFKVVKTSEYASNYDPAQNAWNNSVVEASNLIYAVNESYFKDKPCLIIYTSGTTGRPKGVVLTYGNLDCNINGMIEEWRWTSNDVILHVLPLHHVHGVVNALMVPLYCGATVVMMPKFTPSQVWERLVGNEVNLFMAVPTIYSKLIESYEKNNSIGTITTQYIKSACLEKIRLMVSGSAALPRTVMEKWKEITGHTLLERYGMTELGMVLTNPLKGERIPGAVGKPFPGITVAVGEKDFKDSNKYKILAVGTSKGTKVMSGVKDIQGELLVKGPNVFKEYWNKPEATAESFTVDGWFKTGDTVLFEDGVYKILGRTSVDIIKSGGYKISALDIERHLLEHPDIAECAVIGLPDLTWGQKIGAVIVTKSKERLDLNQLKAWCSDKLPSYQTPSVIQTVDKLQRNAMGKINKKDLLKTVFPHYTKSI